LRSGVRTKSDFDPLWRAACLEIEAEEWEQDGFPDKAAHLRKLAAAVIVMAAGRKAAGVPA
jgi:hypothetical protein